MLFFTGKLNSWILKQEGHFTESQNHRTCSDERQQPRKRESEIQIGSERKLEVFIAL